MLRLAVWVDVRSTVFTGAGVPSSSVLPTVDGQHMMATELFDTAREGDGVGRPCRPDCEGTWGHEPKSRPANMFCRAIDESVCVINIEMLELCPAAQSCDRCVIGRGMPFAHSEGRGHEGRELLRSLSRTDFSILTLFIARQGVFVKSNHKLRTE